jgi:hypothetical protein
MEIEINQTLLSTYVWSLNLELRPKTRLLWLKRGTAFFKRRPNFLFKYWCDRLKNKQNPKELLAAKKLESAVLRGVNLPQAVQSHKINPPISKMAKTALNSAVTWAKSGLKTTSEEMVAKRKAICQNCELWDALALKGTGRCTKCGCSTWAKIRMATEKCPIDKWLPEE